MKFIVLILALFSTDHLLAQSLAGRWSGYYTFDVPKEMLLEIEQSLENFRQRSDSEKAGQIRLDKITADTKAMNKNIPANSGVTIGPARTKSISGNRIVQVETPKTLFQVNCIQNSDGSYDFMSYTGPPVSQWTRMEYEILGKDSLFLIEVGNPGENEVMFQKMLLHITWTKTKRSQVMKMKGPWYNLNGSTPQGEIVLFHEKKITRKRK